VNFARAAKRGSGETERRFSIVFDPCLGFAQGAFRPVILHSSIAISGLN
jgi:hypothetical protein